MNRLLTTLAAALVLAPSALARTTEPAANALPTRAVVTATRLSAPVTVDGSLTEPVWQSAPAFTGFLQSTPLEGAPPSQPTEVRIAYDDDALYMGARCLDASPDSIMARLTRRDVMVPADRIGIYLDPHLDRRSGYYFIVNAAGVQFDGTLMNDGWDDSSWDGVWSAAARRDNGGWSCEMRIPYSQFRFPASERPVWGVNFKRVIPRRNEELYLAYTPRNGSGYVSRFGDLVGLAGLRPGRSIELLPYLTTKGEVLRHDRGDPFRSDPILTPDGGADLRMSLGSRLTLNATVNPDFGQVEVDPAVVNLSDVESFFDEKRPFFVEGMQNFRFGNEGANDYWSFNWPEPMFFYSRRIGRAPQVAPPAAEFAHGPVGTRILGAAKVTGKLTPTTSFGTLHALTARETADLAQGATRWDAEVEPLSYYGATRALKDIRDRRFGLGAITTVVARRFDDDRLRDALNGSSVVAGVDGWAFLDARRRYVVSGYTAVSRVDGSAARIDVLQRSSRHYLQRPDRRHARLEPGATSLAGLVSRYWLNKQEGDVLLNAGLGWIDPRFDNGDIGFMSRTDLLNFHVGTGYQWTKNSAWRRYANVLGSVFGSWNRDGDRKAGAVWGSGRVNLVNNWSSQVNLAGFLESIDDRRTRGGPVMLLKPGAEWYGNLQTDENRPLSWFAEVNGSTQTTGSYNVSVNPNAEWKPASNVLVSVGPGFERVHEDAQWVGNVPDPVASATYGVRHLFATLDQKTYFASLRLNWTFNPRLTLQLYAQPLVSSARFEGFKQLARGRSYDFTAFGGAQVDRTGGLVTITPGDGGAAFALGEPEFDFKSLRGNAVLRWEYLPGSTLFLVWTQERTDAERLGTFGLGRSVDRLLSAKADNIFLAKVTYYFAL
jgi:hypothetical protein